MRKTAPSELQKKPDYRRRLPDTECPSWLLPFFESTETGLGSEIFMRVPQAEQ
jgi:hypothetical protein